MHAPIYAKVEPDTAVILSALILCKPLADCCLFYYIKCALFGLLNFSLIKGIGVTCIGYNSYCTLVR